MHLTKLLPAVVQASPSGKVQGRKRLQKIIHLLKLSGADVEADHYLLHYGPFSDEVASTTENLVYQGTLAEDLEVVGAYKTCQYVYRLGEYAPASYPLGKIDEELVAKLGALSTVELEVASTIGFFECMGESREEAVSEAKLLKPSKTSNELVMASAVKILSLLEETAKKRTASAATIIPLVSSTTCFS
jgi:uncharacterized protein YwgA